MAFGILCKFCGHQESAHECDDSDELLPGMEMTLDNCKDTKGYSPKEEEIDLHERLVRLQDDEEMAQLKREFGEFMQ
ncbi:MAG: hypothetical protein KBB54_00930 [Candidatus Pacebacteria bacterium]|nr:hypothetical protein [Candidatus Paceibacterota bacterium]MBP9818356.1 hypothetical protein [Candidatus Paceibacterota bacterium]